MFIHYSKKLWEYSNISLPRKKLLISKLLIGEKLGSITNMFLPRKKLLISKLLIGANFKEKKSRI